jgi:hypothetical protein
MRGGRPCGCLTLLHDGSRDWGRRHAGCLRRGDRSRLLFSPCRQRLDARGLGTGLKSHHSSAQRQALQGRKAEHPGVGVPTRRQKATSANKSSRKTYDKEVRSRGTYILECTRAFFTGRPDEPCSGAAHFEPANSGAAPLRPAASTMTTRSPARSGPDPPPPVLRDGRGWIVAPAGDEGHVNRPG